MEPCHVIDQIMGAVAKFKEDFGHSPSTMLVGPDVAIHIWEHVKDGILREKDAKPVPHTLSNASGMRIYGIEVQVVACEGLVTFPLLYSEVPKYFSIVNGAETNPDLN